ncbi:response regulator [bacterium]|nr:response regulator [bacterium]
MTETKSTILVIDDSNLSRKKVSSLISDDYHVIQASTAKMALQLINHSKPDCIFCDLLMPEMDGYEFLKKLSESESKIPCTIITADIQKQTYIACIDLGASYILNKPPKKKDLYKSIQSRFK